MGQANLKNAPLPHLHSKRSSLAPAGEIRLDKQRLFLLYSRHIDVMNTIKIVLIWYPWSFSQRRRETNWREYKRGCGGHMQTVKFSIGLRTRLIF